MKVGEANRLRLNWETPAGLADDLHSPAVDGHEWKELGITAHGNHAQRMWRLKSHRVVRSLRHAPR